MTIITACLLLVPRPAAAQGAVLFSDNFNRSAVDNGPLDGPPILAPGKTGQDPKRNTSRKAGRQ